MIGSYQPLKTLGTGAFGTVKLAQKPGTSHFYAIKCISKNNIVRAHMGSQVKTEIQVMKSLDHPNIVKIKEVLISPQNLYIVMQYVSGGELYSRITIHGKLGESEVKTYALQLLDALRYCHSKYICHRDIKPQNILLNSEGNPLLADFGFAKIMAEHTASCPDSSDDTSDERAAITVIFNQADKHKLSPKSLVSDTTKNKQLSTICGAMPYMSPEILNLNKYPGDKTDIWSLAVVFFVLLVGHVPFNDGDTARDHLVCPKQFSRDVSDFLKQMMSAKSVDRPTAAELLDHPWLENANPVCNKQVREKSSGSEVTDEDDSGAEVMDDVNLSHFTIWLYPGHRRDCLEVVRQKMIEEFWNVKKFDDKTLKASVMSPQGLVMVVLTFHAQKIDAKKINITRETGAKLMKGLRDTIQDLVQTN
uniref:non-specific serine/threonine protein kinase n=1 Tax=Feldmannia species virus TaxID=39420 RepID=O55396_9PHYC|nr:serine/threonine protein kinase [Feldmannia species virus]